MIKKGKRIITAVCTLIISSMLFTFSTVFAADNSDTQTPNNTYWKVIKYDDVKAYRNNPEEIDGYLFAGWFKEESCAKSTALRSSDKEGLAYAKYVPEEILGLKAQVNAELWDEDTTNDDANGAIRFVTSVDSRDYAEVGFKIDIGNGEKTKSSNKVYQTLYVKVGETDSAGEKTDEFVAKEIFHASSIYFKTWTVTDVTNVDYGTEFKVTPFWKTLDGTEVRGAQSIKTVNQGRSWEYVYVDDEGDDATGVGTLGRPYKTLEKALSEMAENQQEPYIEMYSADSTDGTVYVLNTLTATSEFAWDEHDLDVIITGDTSDTADETIDFSKLIDLKMGDAATFTKLAMKMPTAKIYANGHRLKIAQDVNADTTNKPNVYGGSGTATVEITDVTLRTGSYGNIYAGGNGKSVSGNTNLYIGGDVELSTKTVYGGCYNNTVSGDTHVTIDGNAKVQYVRGAGNAGDTGSQSVEGTCYVTIEGNAQIEGVNGGGAGGSTNNTYVVVRGGTVDQVFGGQTKTGGTVNNTNVYILGGNITRRIYGGSYNETSGLGWDDNNYHVNGYSAVTIGNGATLSFTSSELDHSVCAVSRNGSNIEPEIGIMILNAEKTGMNVGFKNMSIISGAGLYAHFQVNVGSGGTVTSENDVLRIVPDNNSRYATVKDSNGNVLFQCQGEGTYSMSNLSASSNVQKLSVTFSDTASLSGNYVLSYGDNSNIYFESLSEAMASVSTPKVNENGESIQKTATITIHETNVVVDSALVLRECDNVVIQNAEGIDVTITRGTSLTDANMFDIANGCSLTISGTIVVDGNGTNVKGPAMIKNAGIFTLGEGTVLQNAATEATSNATTYNGSVLYIDGITAMANIYGSVKNNTAFNGGAIYIANDAVVNIYETSIVEENTATNQGGAIFVNRGTLGANGAKFKSNSAKGDGGTIYINGYYSSQEILAVANLNACVFGGNEEGQGNASTTASGGALYVKGILIADNCEFINQSSKTHGGAICIYNGSNYTASAQILNSIFTGNNAEGRSGAIDVNGGNSESVVVANCTFNGNSSSNGATIAVAGGKTLNISDSTFSETEEGNAATIHMRTNAASAVLSGKVTRVTFTNSGDGDLATILVGGYINEDSDISITPYEYVENEFVLGACENVSPKTLELATKIFDVTQVSGNYWFINSTGALSQVVAKINGTEGSYADVLATIADTSSAAEIQFLRDVEISETIEIPTGANVSITNAAGENVTLTRTGAFDMFNVATDGTLSIGNADSTNTITIDGANIESIASSLVENSGTFNLLANATLTGGNAGTSNNARGGALHNATNATAMLYGTVIDNIAYNGGAIYNQGTLTIEDGTYVDNMAYNGGGVIYGDGTVTINAGTFHDNETTSATAGVVYCSGTLNINGGTFYKNSAKTGGGVANVAGTAIIKNATMYENFLTGSSYAGGAIYVSGSKTLTLEDCNIYNNASNYVDNTNPGSDVSLSGKTILNLKDNVNVGIVQLRYASNDVFGTINVQELYTGKMMLLPFNNVYKIGLQVITFADGTSSSAENIVVRKYTSASEYDDEAYCVDADGLLQYKGAEAKIGTITYPTLAEAITVATSGDTVFVLKDIEVSETIPIGNSENTKEITITNVSGKDIQLTRTSSVSMFTVASGSALTIGSTDTTNKLILDGGYDAQAEELLTGASLVYNEGVFEVSANSTLQNASTGGTSDGGALYNKGTASIYGNMLGNMAKEGGAIKNDGGSVTIYSGTYCDNVSLGGAGGVIHSGTSGNEVTIHGGFFKGNEAKKGTAGVIYFNGTLTINGGEYRENKAVTGGGVLNVGGTATITNAIMEDNSLTGVDNAGGAIYVSGNKTLTLTDCTIIDNVGEHKSNTVPGCDISLGNNTILNLYDNADIGIVLQRYGTTPKINVMEEYITPIILVPYYNAPKVDAQLVYFDSTMTAEARKTSAENMTVRKYASKTEYNDDTYYVDSDGYVRITSNVAKIGDVPYETLAAAVAAVETSDATTIYVLRDSDVNENIAIGSADATRNITITNAPGVDVTLTRTSSVSMFTVANGSDLVIGDEKSANKITIDGGYVTDAEEPLIGSSLINNAGTFTISANATLQNSNAGENNGGALYTTGNVYIYGIIKDNSANNGGAIYIESGALEATSATFSGNIASSNGGALNGGYNTATIKLDACTLEGNESTSSGGAIYSRYKLEVYNNCSFIDNISGSSGGAISVYKGNNNYTTTITVIENATFTGNISVSRASALDINGYKGSVTISGCEFEKNSDASKYNSTIQIQGNCAPVLSNCTFNGNQSGETDELYMYNGTATLRISGKMTGIKITNLQASQLIISGAIEDNSDITLAGRTTAYEEGTVVLAQGETVSSEQLAQAATIIKVAPTDTAEWTIASDGTLKKVVTE